MFRRWTALFFVLFLAGCSRGVRLMPTPLVLTNGQHNLFSVNPELERSNLIDIFYSTNRLPLGPRGNRVYTIVAGQTLYLGKASVRIGPSDKAWEELYELSTTNSDRSRPVLRLESLNEQATIRANQSRDSMTREARGYFEQINQALARSLDKDLTIYVHGANSNMEIAAAQAAQYRHFTGRNTVVVMFAWPSAERGVRYFTDVANARATVPAFARFLDLLARHTNAKHINVVAYSAGSQVVSPGLVALRRMRLGDQARQVPLGEIYFAAPDLAFPTFVRQAPLYIGMARRVTVSVNLNDSVLALSSWFHGVSRLGRPDPTELSEEDSKWLVEAAKRLNFDVISVRPDVIPGLSRRSHSFWYDHPWVSSDVMLKLLFHVSPAERGLEQKTYKDLFPVWTFPPDYDQRIVPIMDRLRSTPFGSNAVMTEEPVTGSKHGPE